MSTFRRGRIAHARLTPSEVHDIREKYASGLYTQGELCRAHGVSIGTIGRILRGETWQSGGAAAADPADAKLSPEAEERLRQNAKAMEARLLAELAAGSDPGEPTKK